MAAAVMRAMTFGASSSSSSLANSTSSPASSRGRDGSASRSRSRSSSKQRPGGKGAHNDGEDEGRAALSRTSSVLLSSAPEVQPQSILLNPSTTRSPPLSPAQAPVSSSLTGRVDDDLDLDDLQSPTPRPGYARSTSTSSVASHNGVPVTPLSAAFPTEGALLAARNAAPSAPTSPSRPPNTQRASKIRFAPLPEIRPRAYSTGRNVWVVEEDDPTATGGRRQRLVRVNGEYDDDDEDFGDSDFARFDDDSALGTSPSNSLMKWGSWTEALGLSPSTSRRSADEDALSLTSSVSPSSESGLSAAFGSPGSGGSSKKILKALGLGGKTGKTKRTGKENDDHLTRTSSAESHSSHGRRASMSEGTAPPRAQGSTGIPMQRSSTWEVGDVPESKGPEIAGERGAGPVYYASPARTSRRRAQYPPVAQGRNRRKVRGNVAVEEPAFEEWGAVGVGSNAKKRSVVGSAPSDNGFDDDDDGTGMAWLRRRRLQREQEERERALQEVALAEAAEQHGSAPLESQPPSVDAVSSSANEFTGGEENQDTLTRDPTQRGPTDEDRRMPLPFLIRTPPSRSGTVDSTVSTASTVRPSSPATSTKPSGLSATRPVLAVDTHVETAAEADQQADDDALLSPGEIGEDDDEAAIESESESSEAESEDDDLDEEELAREEALAEEARRMAKSMGAERYHSARHENQLKVVDA